MKQVDTNDDIHVYNEWDQVELDKKKWVEELNQEEIEVKWARKENIRLMKNK